MPGSLPTLTSEQRAEALHRPAQTREKSAEFTARLRTGDTPASTGLDEVLGDMPLAKIKLTSLLRTLPEWGQASVAYFLEANSIAVNRRLGGLGSIQLSAVRAALAD
ncbi:integration host factor, actinobacterial type [Corynebacterium sp. AOP34-AQ2-28]|uniref:integration host factor, actinobacterial type n=1 Tax=Corynebacterium sp. AOP34-AQ2-28 TaxID=3457689 RepID=UPI004033FFAD